MDADTALEKIIAAGVQYSMRISVHAMDDHPERNLSFNDICWAASTAKSATLQDNGKWIVEGGKDLDGQPTTLICAVRDGVFVVTAW